MHLVSKAARRNCSAKVSLLELLAAKVFFANGSLLLSILACLLAGNAWAANDTWSGSGADNYWSTAANWGGTAPANNDNLVFSGTTRQLNTNDFSALTIGWLRFANGGFSLNGNLLTLNPTTGGIFTNLAGTNIIANSLIITPATKYWSIAPNSELRLAGVITNTALTGTTAGWLCLTNGGAVRILNIAESERGMDLFQGAVIVDGGFVQANNDGIRFKPPAGSTATVILTNNGTIRIGGGGNFRMGNGGGTVGGVAGAGSLSQMSMSSGTLELFGSATVIYVGDTIAGATGVFNQNGGLVWGSSGSGNTLTIGNTVNADGTYNLNGGILWIAQVLRGNTSATNSVFNFNGGTLKPTGSSASFFQGLLKANVQNGGAIVDTTNFNITIAQNLLAAGTGAGGFTKLGGGALTLSGANTYGGPTTVSNGTLNVTGTSAGSGAVTVASGGALAGSGSIAGAVTVQAGGALSPGAVAGAPTTLTLQGNLTLAGNVSIEVNKSLSPASDLVSVAGTMANTGSGTLTVANVGSAAFAAGDSFQVFNKPLPNGGALTILPNPPVLGMLWTNGLAVDGTVGIISTVGTNTAANLSNLALGNGALSPSFNSNTIVYPASLTYSNSLITVTPTAASAGATIQVFSAGGTNPVLSGVPSSPIALNPGTNFIDVRVTSADASVVRDYMVTVTRLGPNIILILADDQGFSDWSCYGGEIKTPNLDNLAATGLRFRNFYNAARCSPTRCAILTGLYTQQAAVDPAASLPPLRTDNNITIAELLGANGYHTYMAGKWHLGSGTGQAPEQRGFDEVFTYVNGSDDHEDEWTPADYRFASTDGETTNINYAGETFYQPDVIGDYCMQFMGNQLARHTNSPFFMYVPFGSAHFLLQAPQAMVDTNVALYASGWDAVRYQRYTNMLAQGVIDPRYALSPNEGPAPWSTVPAEVIPAWNALDTNRQADLTRRMAVYATMIEKMDANIGRIVQYLQQQGQLDNTLIMALSDNGCNYEGGVYGLTGGTSDAAPLTGASLENMGQSNQPSLYLGGGWAHVSNTPFRLFKHFDHFGGIGTPFIVHWPQGLTRSNQWENQSGHIIDVMATIVDVTGASYPTQFNGHAVWPMVGQSLKPLFTNSSAAVPRNLGFEHEGNRAYISGNWKLVTKNFTSVDNSSYANELELYNLTNDPSETTNLAFADLTELALMVTNWNNWCTFVGDPSTLLITWLSNAAPINPPAPAPNTNDLFLDTFARPNNTNIDASAVGMSGSLVPPLGVDAAYYQGYDSQYLVISNNTLYKVTGGMVESGLIHNFVDQSILDAGGFSVELNILAINSDSSDSSNRYVGFGVGLTQAQAASGGDIYSMLSPGQVTFRGAIGGNTGVSPFFVDLNLNGNIEVWTNGVLVNTISVGGGAGILTASFACTGFTTNDPVTANVFYNGELVNINPGGTNNPGLTFYWGTNNANYVGLSARASNYNQMDNLAIRKLPLANGLIADYAMSYGLTGTNTAAGADPDGDGVSNFAEWAFGGNPDAPDAYIAGFKGIQVLPGNDFIFEYQRYRYYAAVGLQYRYLVSSDLVNWTETTPTILATSINEDKTDYEVVTLELPSAATAGQGKLFLRILATTN
jgi:autotransporter-associated beta strand protein